MRMPVSRLHLEAFTQPPRAVFLAKFDADHLVDNVLENVEMIVRVRRL